MLDRRQYFIREHVGFLKLTDMYDILDPATQQQLGVAQEKPGTLFKYLRLLINKQLLPTKVFVYAGGNPEDEQGLLFSIHRPVAFFRPTVKVHDAAGNLVGFFKSKLISLGGAFYVHDAAGAQVAFVKGDWKGWNFRFLDGQENELGTVTKKWAGLGKELFTSADNYMISLNGEPTPAKALLLLAAGLAIDIVYKERGRG